jgi:alkaline phosphatase
MSHSNNATRRLESMRALDETVEILRAYAAEHPDTLLVVTATTSAAG